MTFFCSAFGFVGLSLFSASRPSMVEKAQRVEIRQKCLERLQSVHVENGCPERASSEHLRAGVAAWPLATSSSLVASCWHLQFNFAICIPAPSLLLAVPPAAGLFAWFPLAGRDRRHRIGHSCAVLVRCLLSKGNFQQSGMEQAQSS